MNESHSEAISHTINVVSDLRDWFLGTRNTANGEGMIRFAVDCDAQAARCKRLLATLQRTLDDNQNAVRVARKAVGDE